MVHRAAPPRTQRVAVLATVFALHAAFLALLLQHSKIVVPNIERSAISVVSIDAERPAAAKPPPPSLPAKVADTFKPLLEFSIPEEIESDAPVGATGACSTLEGVLDALLLDAVAVDAIRRAPPETRSISQAVVMWNEGWSPAALDALAPLGPVRINIERSLARIDDRCLDEPVAGPRLLPIPDGTETGTMFVVLGSGVWTWRALIQAPPLPTAVGAPPAPIAPPTR